MAGDAAKYQRIGITGANGFIGAHLMRSAIEKGLRPVAFLQRGTPLAPIEELTGCYEGVDGDLLDPDSVNELVARCDAIIHLAGLNRYWARPTTQFHDINVQGVKNLIAACERYGIRKLVHVSSCITLGASDDPTPRDEEAPYNIGFPFLYGETKKAGEDEIKRAVREQGLPAVIVNPASAIGERDFAPTPIGRPIAAIARGTWPVYVAGGACFIDVHDVVRGLWLALERGKPGGQYLLAGENMTNREFMTLVSKLAGTRPPRIAAPKPLVSAVASIAELVADRLTRTHPAVTTQMAALVGKYLYFDGRRAARELGFSAGPIAPAIERCITWFRTRSPR